MSITSPLVKLSTLLLILPWTVTYLHLYYYTFWQHEYCFVGPPSSSSVLTLPLTVGYDNLASSDNKIRNVDDINFIYGIYAPVAHKKKKGEDPLNGRTFRQRYNSNQSRGNNDATLATSTAASWFNSNGNGWPSLTQAAMIISAPSSTLSKYSHVYNTQNAARNNQHEIVFIESNDNENKWCLKSGQDEWCSTPFQYPKGTIHQYPPSGIYTQSSQSQISITCPHPTTAQPTKSKHHKPQNGKQNQNLKFILHHPTTTLLLLLNTLLAYQYWNHRIPPSLVSKNYNKICLQNEWWRSFTGATAHFEPLHLGFNMMSLYTLGKELEGGFSSVVFMVYNVALVVVCSVVMIGMVYGRLWLVRRNGGQQQQQQQEREKRLIETSTVGYSGVLFAWMVITTLERNQATCPIPFFSDVCFATHHVPGLPWLKFNIAPIVSLFVAQFIMPRVSFMGHLAGIACGFGLHWGWAFPPLEVCSPNVLIGAVYLVGCLFVSQRTVPVRPLSNEPTLGSNEQVDSEEGLLGSITITNRQNEESSIDIDDEVTDPFMRGKQRKKEREMEEVLRKQRTLVSIRNLMAFTSFASVFFFDISSSLVLSQFILLAYFTFGTQASVIVWTYTHINKAENDIIDPEKQRAGVIWKGYIVAATLSIVVDAMSLASWVALHAFISVETSPRVGLIPVCLFMMIVRTTTNALGLIASSKVLYDFGQVGGGIFVVLFSWVVSCSKAVGDVLFLTQAPLWTAFEGRGIRLGSRTR